MEASILGLYYIGIMETKMETTIMGYIGILGTILGLYWDIGSMGQSTLAGAIAAKNDYQWP